MEALKQITATAKRLRKEHPKKYITWKEAIAAASILYKKKHPVKAATKKNVNKKIKRMPTKKRSVNIKISGTKKPTESAVFKQIKKTEADIRKLERMQKQQLYKGHKVAIGSAIKKKKSHIKSLIGKV